MLYVKHFFIRIPRSNPPRQHGTMAIGAFMARGNVLGNYCLLNDVARCRSCSFVPRGCMHGMYVQPLQSFFVGTMTKTGYQPSSQSWELLQMVGICLEVWRTEMEGNPISKWLGRSVLS